MVAIIFQKRSYFFQYGIFYGLIYHFFFSFCCRLNINITTFTKSFSESFLNFVLTLNTTLKWDPSDITPPTWELWNGANEMVFNVTEAGVPDIHTVRTSSALLERCE
jgi:cholinesterase